MEQYLGLIILLVVGVPIGVAIWLIVRAVRTRRTIEELSVRLRCVEDELRYLKHPTPVVPTHVPEAVRPAPIIPSHPAPLAASTQPPIRIKPLPPVATPTPTQPIPASAPISTSIPVRPAAPPPLPPVRAWPKLPPPEPAQPAINWEQFMGVKGFAWLGGLALFLGVAFFVKYSFDNNLVPPAVRVAIGFVVGLGLVVGGIVMSRRNFAALSQTLCATGVVVLYAVTFACRAYYHFLTWPGTWWDALPAFAIMALITASGFLLAVRLNALVVAILGLLGGFLTPILLSTGQDNPAGLFGYVAILDTGLILIALNRRWDFLPALAAAGTFLMQAGWASEFFEREKYFEGNKILIALGVLLGFNALYLGANWLAKRRGQSNWWLAGSNLGLALVALGFTAYFFDFPTLAQRPVLLFGYVFLIDLVVTFLSQFNREAEPAQPATGLLVFGLLGVWTAEHLTNELLNPALVWYLVFAGFHSVLPVWRARLNGGATGHTRPTPSSPQSGGEGRGEEALTTSPLPTPFVVGRGNQRAGSGGAGVELRAPHGAQSSAASKAPLLFPPLALMLVLIPIFKLPELSFLVWPFVLFVDLIAIVLAAMTAMLLPVLAVLVLTLAATAMMILKIPTDLTGLPLSFCLLGGFAVFFVAVSVWLVERVRPNARQSGLSTSGDIFEPDSVAAILPISSAVLPFLLLIMATLRLPMANPSPVFGLSLLLVVLLLGLTRLFVIEWMPVAGLVSAFAVECAWHFNRFDLSNPHSIAPAGLVGWYLVFFAVFTVYPFLFLKKFSASAPPWIAAALAGPAQFLLIYCVVKVAWPNNTMGLLPAAFAIPALLCLVIVLKRIPAESRARMTQLAWFGGVALFFITLIFPIQFDRQWITIGWALEGAALLWLFHRVPHRGLQLTGCGLLVAAFARLACNPAVLEYHARSTTPIFNWYLYSYGIVTAAHYAGARLLAPPRHKLGELPAQGILGGLGTVLAFLLLNIEIADYFSAPGSTLTFQFSGDFARDMTYSIAWGLFALGLLVYGIWKQNPIARYSGMGLLGVTLLKLFFHDLAQLGQLYRIGAFVGVAVIAMVASFAYQKFFSAAAKPAAAPDEPKP